MTGTRTTVAVECQRATILELGQVITVNLCRLAADVNRKNIREDTVKRKVKVRQVSESQCVFKVKVKV